MSLIAATLFATSLIAPEAQKVLDQGQWGLITGDLSGPSISAAKTCEGPWISFSFSGSEIQIIPHEGKKPPSVPPEVYLAARFIEEAPHARIDLFSGVADETATRSYRYDPAVKSLMRLMPDGDGDALYVLCD